MRISDWSSDVCSSDLAEHIESFVTKARDQNASKTVVVSAAGFQSGAVLVAGRHGVDSFTVTFVESKIRLPSDMTYTIIGNYPVDVARNPIYCLLLDRKRVV